MGMSKLNALDLVLLVLLAKGVWRLPGKGVPEVLSILGVCRRVWRLASH